MKLVPIAANTANPINGTVAPHFLENTTPHAVFQNGKIVYTAPLAFNIFGDMTNVIDLKAFTKVDGTKDDDVINVIYIDSIVYQNSTGKRITEMVPQFEPGQKIASGHSATIRLLSTTVEDGSVENTYHFYSHTNCAAFIIQFKINPLTGKCQLMGVAADGLTASRHSPIGVGISVDRVPAEQSNAERKVVKIALDKDSTREDIEKIVKEINEKRAKEQQEKDPFGIGKPWVPNPPGYGPYRGGPFTEPRWPNQYPGDHRYPNDRFYMGNDQHQLSTPPYQTISQVSERIQPTTYGAPYNNPVDITEWMSRSGFEFTLSGQLELSEKK